jgi:hypothetical protein
LKETTGYVNEYDKPYEEMKQIEFIKP